MEIKQEIRPEKRKTFIKNTTSYNNKNHPLFNKTNINKTTFINKFILQDSCLKILENRTLSTIFITYICAFKLHAMFFGGSFLNQTERYTQITCPQKKSYIFFNITGGNTAFLLIKMMPDNIKQYM